MEKMQRYLWPTVVAIAAALFIFGGALVALYTDWLWFKDLGYDTVFATRLVTKAQIGLLFGFMFFGIIYGNLWYARKIAPPPSRAGLEQQLIERLGNLARRGIGLLLFAGSVVISGMVGLEAATHWEDWLLYTNATSFGTTDPLFGRDIGFYVFQLPFLKYVYYWLSFALLAATVASAALHYADEAIEFFANRLQFAPKVKSHLAVLVALLFFLKAWGYRLGMYDLLFARGSLFDGAGFTDVQARLPALWIMIGVAVLGGLLVLANTFRRGISLAVAGFALVMVASIAVGSGYPGMVQQFSVKPNELEKETPYIKRAITATQAAYGLDTIAARPFEAETSLTAAQVEANSATIENIRLWDKDHLQSAYNQIQTIQQYYRFTDVDVDRYWLTDAVTGERRYRQVWLSARELDTSALPSNSQTWFNTRLQYTHGYGFCMSPVNEVSPQGLPAFFVYDIPPKTATDIQVDRPGVYFGEITNNQVFVNTKAKEFDYQSGAGAVHTKYEADGGVAIGSLFRKMLFSLRFSDVSMLLNTDINSESKVLYQRNVADRVRTLMPFLLLDKDPYLVTVGGNLYWMIDAYTTTDAYPYSHHMQVTMSNSGFASVRTFNYIRNSVKVVVDAYTGAVDAYVIQKPHEDPIIKAYQKIFPGVLKPISKMPKDLREHIRYPEDLFKTQVVIYKRYHQADPMVFYNNSDLWEIAARAEIGGSNDQPTPMEPYYTIMKLPNGQSEEFILMSPFIRAGKFNMVAWMCAKCDPEDYGRLVLYQFPKDKNVYGPQQVTTRIKQDTYISQQITLWGQQGSRVSSGNLLVIPIESSLLYVIPLYLESGDTKIPELKRVIVALGNKVAMEPTLEEALAGVVGAPIAPVSKIGEAAPSPGAPGVAPGAAKPAAPVVPGVPSAGRSAEVNRLVNQAASQIRKAEEAQKKGDWAGYGEQIGALKKTVEELRSRTQ